MATMSQTVNCSVQCSTASHMRDSMQVANTAQCPGLLRWWRCEERGPGCGVGKLASRRGPVQGRVPAQLPHLPARRSLTQHHSSRTHGRHRDGRRCWPVYAWAVPYCHRKVPPPHTPQNRGHSISSLTQLPPLRLHPDHHHNSPSCALTEEHRTPLRLISHSPSITSGLVVSPCESHSVHTYA